MKCICTIFLIYSTALFAQAPLKPSSNNTALDSYHAQNWQSRFNTLLTEGKKDSAQAVAVASLAYLGSSLETCAYYARLFWEIQEFEKAAFWIEKLYAAAPSDTLHSGLAVSYYNAGAQKAQAYQWKSAAVLFEKSVRNGYHERIAYRSWAYCLAKAESYAAALDVIEKGFKKYPDYNDLLQIQGYILVQKRDFETLERKYADYVKRNPADVAAALELSRIRQMRGQYKSALSGLEALKKQHPDDLKIYEALSSVQRDAGKTAGERETYMEILRRTPSADTLHLKIARTWENEGNYPQARSSYRRYLESHKMNIETRVRIAQTFEKDNRIDSALSEYKSILALKPDYAPALSAAGQACEKLGKLDSALSYYKQWGKKETYTAEPFTAQGIVLERMEKTADALKAYERAERNGGSSASAYRLFSLHYTKGNKKDAQKYQFSALRRLIEEITQDEERIEKSVDQAAILKGNSEEYLRAQRMAADLKRKREELAYVTLNWIAEPQSLERALDQVRERQSAVPVIYETLGRIFAGRREWDRAQESYEQLLALRPKSFEGHRGLVDILVKTHRYDDAFAACQRLVELNLDNSDSYDLAIRTAAKADMLDALAGRWETLLRAHKDNATLKKNLIRVYNQLGRNDKVMILLDQGR